MVTFDLKGGGGETTEHVEIIKDISLKIDQSHICIFRLVLKCQIKCKFQIKEKATRCERK